MNRRHNYWKQAIDKNTYSNLDPNKLEDIIEKVYHLLDNKTTIIINELLTSFHTLVNCNTTEDNYCFDLHFYNKGLTIVTRKNLTIINKIQLYNV